MDPSLAVLHLYRLHLTQQMQINGLESFQAYLSRPVLLSRMSLTGHRVGLQWALDQSDLLLECSKARLHSILVRIILHCKQSPNNGGSAIHGFIMRSQIPRFERRRKIATKWLRGSNSSAAMFQYRRSANHRKAYLMSVHVGSTSPNNNVERATSTCTHATNFKLPSRYHTHRLQLEQ